MALASNPEILTGIDLMDALVAEVAVIGRDGTIVLANEAWCRFANQNGAESRLQSGVGLNYLDACRSAFGDGSDVAEQVLAGLEDLLSGKRQQFSL
jgi:PAS domain-containing protein